ncbi:hypothetical protein HYG86_12720 [Alkalicella caledoniensis]|uniref:Uncharacterized protein n=1 Tax=Alkalicella caledoniensis TaxID=2731377 RepID=A0A7G9WA59_ALKCA|nr:hypothetical protein [Alkalicella caledoniensis]QNO15571.1 hypothetical protein HYG86_12720 [Alkalicella caledoniensis]
MSAAAAGAGAAAAAAAAAEAQRREEEERLTSYTKEDLTEGWEFKIVRSGLGFKGDKFKELCEEEAKNGWQLVEKFDETRVRFKRPISARENDKYAEIDPYRTTYSKGEAKVVLVTLGIVFFVSAVIIGIVVFFATR